MMIFYLLVGTISVVGNILVLIVVYKSKQLRHSQYVYNCSIAVSDIIWGFYISSYFFTRLLRLWSLDPMYIVEQYDSTSNVTKYKNNLTIYEYRIQSVLINDKLFYLTMPYELSLHFTLLYIIPITLFVSFISLVFSSIDRYVALTFPFKYKQINSEINETKSVIGII